MYDWLTRLSAGQRARLWIGLLPRRMVSPLLFAAVAACNAQSGGADAASDTLATAAPVAVSCADGNGGITLPDGFCATVFADSLGRARHIVVQADGDVYVALSNARRGARGGIVALRDTSGDGVADVTARFGDNGGTGIALYNGALYFATDGAVLRYALAGDSLAPSGPPDTIVSGLPDDRSHTAKSIEIAPDGALYINIGAPSNSCQRQDRELESPGIDPCPQLERRAGIWKFDAGKPGQTQADGERYATGIRNAVAVELHPETNVLYALQHGRDQLHANWPDLYTEQESAEQPGEEFLRVRSGDDFGWPYCYYDTELGRKVLAPEYGGNAERAGRCTEIEEPLLAFPGHWAPNGLLFYSGEQFPERYQGGAFIAFHGSWNRAPLPQQGYNIVFVPFAEGNPSGDYETFADGFAGERKEPGAAAHRPVGLAQGPDGSLYITDDSRGRIWRVMYAGGSRPTGG
ncbi:MAG: PQQ-dependent sugar dehydrogenase [Gemmatimonadaceae bacterium]